MATEPPSGPFLTERRVLGLAGAAVVATIGYWAVTRIALLEAIVFFVIFAAVFTGLNYAIHRYD
jgi:hypothetical protein